MKYISFDVWMLYFWFQGRFSKEDYLRLLETKSQFYDGKVEGTRKVICYKNYSFVLIVIHTLNVFSFFSFQWEVFMWESMVMCFSKSEEKLYEMISFKLLKLIGPNLNLSRTSLFFLLIKQTSIEFVKLNNDS